MMNSNTLIRRLNVMGTDLINHHADFMNWHYEIHCYGDYLNEEVNGYALEAKVRSLKVIRHVNQMTVASIPDFIDETNIEEYLKGPFNAS